MINILFLSLIPVQLLSDVCTYKKLSVCVFDVRERALLLCECVHFLSVRNSTLVCICSSCVHLWPNTWHKGRNQQVSIDPLLALVSQCRLVCHIVSLVASSIPSGWNNRWLWLMATALASVTTFAKWIPWVLASSATKFFIFIVRCCFRCVIFLLYNIERRRSRSRRHYISRHDWIWWLRRFYGVNASALSYRSVCFDSNAIVAYKRKENLGRQLGCCCQHGDTHSWDLVSLLAATKDNFRVFGRRRRVFWNSHSWAYTQTDVIKK